MKPHNCYRDKYCSVLLQTYLLNFYAGAFTKISSEGATYKEKNSV